MPVNVFNSTTLSSAITASDINFQVAATTNISAGDFLAVRGELMYVSAKDDPASGYIKVRRGVNGTAAWSHPTSERVWIFANAHDAKQAAYSNSDFGSGFGNGIALVGDSGDLPDFALPGTRARDGKGNEYIAVEMTEPAYRGVTCVISKDGNFQASILSTGTSGAVGLTTENYVTSDQITWLQIYGYNSAAKESGGTSNATSSYFCVAATSVSTPEVGMAAVLVTSADQVFIEGMFIQGAASTATTSASSATGVSVPVFLNYPWVKSTSTYQALVS